MRPYADALLKHRFAYYSTSCRFRTIPHTTYLSGAVDDVVLEILAEVFDRERLKVAVRSHRERSDSLAERIGAIRKRLHNLEEEIDGASGCALAAQVELERHRRQAGGSEGSMALQAVLEHWNGVMTGLQRKRLELNEELADLTKREGDFRGLKQQDLERILGLAENLPTLLARARELPDMLAPVVDELVEQIWMRSLGQTVFEIELVFPGGGSVRRIVKDGRIACAQAARVWCYHRLNEGVPVAEVGRELMLAELAIAKRGAWEESRVRGAAAIHEHFERELPRDGEHVTLSGLAELTGEPLSVITGTALLGRLGPARWSPNGLALQPTEPELHAAFPGFAVRELGRVHGIDPADLIRINELRRYNRTKSKRIQYLEGRHLHVWKDAAGKRYLSRSAAAAEGLATEPDPGPQVRNEELGRRVAALGRVDLLPENFHPIWWLLREWQARFRFVTPKRLKTAIAGGHVIAVTAPGPNSIGRPMKSITYIHVPARVLRAKKPQAVRDWLWPAGEPSKMMLRDKF